MTATSWLPKGSTLPFDVWVRRHRAILTLLWLHVPGLFVFGLVRGEGLVHSLAESTAVALFAAAATVLLPKRRLSTVLVALGLFTSSAVLVHLSGGFIEMHFHYFVMVGVVTLYQDWRPFLIAIGYVVVQHGLAGALSPESVYNHPAAVNYPWHWAGIHGLFVLGMSAAGIASWKLNESLLEAAEDREARLHEAQEVARLGSWEWHIPSGRVTWSDQMYHLMGVSGEDFSPSYESFFSRIHPEDRAALSRDVQRAIEEGRPYNSDFRAVLPGDALSWLHVRAEVTERDNGQATVFSGTVQDVTERKRLERELAHQAFHDSLTDLANQALFRDRVEHALLRAVRRESTVAVVFLDLDNFKTVNDSLGHNAGDQLLVAVAKRLTHHLRAEDTAARLGGDEFAVLLEDLGAKEEASSVANRLIEAFLEPFQSSGREMFVTASIGIALQEPSSTGDQLLRNADLAMYTAKSTGKGRVEMFQPSMHTAAVDRLDLEADLRQALQRGELTVQYQPIVSVGSGAISSLEALVRWNHPERGPLPPVVFIPLAEETGLIHELGRQVLLQACIQGRRWQVAHPTTPPLAISVNLSPAQLERDDLVGHVTDALTLSGLPADTLILEITEGAMMQNTKATISKLTDLKALGVRLAIDDFGTGYSSLSYLQQFPVDIVKIDRSFVAAMGTEEEKASLPRALVSLAQTLKLEAVAEGVETASQLELLSELGCDFVQGYYLSRPGDVGAVGELMADGLADNSVSPQPVQSPA